MYTWPQKPFILAHRGARSQAPENTLAAFRKAFELGADGFECDVFLSRDGIPVIIHDQTLDRTTSQKGFVWDYDAKDLQALGVPTLQEALEIIPSGGIINIELKGCKPFSPEYLGKQIKKLLNHYVIISSFDTELLKVWHGYPTGLLFEADQPIELPKDWRPDALNIDFSCLHIIPAGYKTILWTAKDFKTAGDWLALGVNGVIAEC
ncbi:MAG: glycerophosphodiester phosphodiesterase family protein [Myxococcaceae bacterium]